jgi:hypothetical protein
LEELKEIIPTGLQEIPGQFRQLVTLLETQHG